MEKELLAELKKQGIEGTYVPAEDDSMDDEVIIKNHPSWSIQICSPGEYGLNQSGGKGKNFWVKFYDDTMTRDAATIVKHLKDKAKI